MRELLDELDPQLKAAETVIQHYADGSRWACQDHGDIPCKRCRNEIYLSGNANGYDKARRYIAAYTAIYAVVKGAEQFQCGENCDHAEIEHIAFDNGFYGREIYYEDAHLREIYRIGESVGSMDRKGAK